MNKKNRGILYITFINIFILTILLFLFECFLQIREYTSLKISRNIEVSKVNTFFNYNLFLQTRPNKTIIGVNKYGFRSPEISQDKKTDTIRIAFLGGSTTLAWMNKYENTYPALLFTLLKDRFPHKNIEFINAGCDWYTTQHSIINYLFTIKDFKPDVIIVMHAVNDLIRSFVSDKYSDNIEYKPDYSHYYGHVTRLIKLNTDYLGYKLFSKFLLLNKIRTRFFPKHDSDGLVPITIDEFKSLPSFDRNLKTFIDIAHADGAQLIFATEASLYQNDEKILPYLWMMSQLCAEHGKYPDCQSMQNGMLIFNNTIRKTAETYKIPLADIDRAVPKTLDFLKDDVHLTAAGNKIIAEELYNVIITNEQLTKLFTE